MTTSNSDQSSRNGDVDQLSPDQGWFVASEGRQHGPLSAAQAWRLVTNRPETATVHVWHPTLPAWQSLASAKPNAEIAVKEATKPTDPERTGLQLDDFRLSNAFMIAGLACAISPVFVLGAAFVRDVQDTTITLVFVALVAYLGWWLYLEQYGVRLERGEIDFPARVALWPYPAWKKKHLKINEISGFECWGHGQFLHWFRLHAGRKPSQILLDNTLHREVLKMALERRIPQLPKSA